MISEWLNQRRIRAHLLICVFVLSVCGQFTHSLISHTFCSVHAKLEHTKHDLSEAERSQTLKVSQKTSQISISDTSEHEDDDCLFMSGTRQIFGPDDSLNHLVKQTIYLANDSTEHFYNELDALELAPKASPPKRV